MRCSFLRACLGLKHRYGSIATVLSVAFIACSMAAFADENSGSLDNLWSDQSAPAPGGASADSKSGAAAPASASAAVPSASPPSVNSAPLCAWDSFRDSSLVQKGGWPGIGPFKAEGDFPYEMVDANHNRLKVAVSDGKVTQASMSIASEKPANQEFLPLQMSADFLLESVGIRPKKIADFNKEMAKNREAVLFKNDNKTLEFPVGRCLVTVTRRAASSGSGDYLVRVFSQDASKDALAEHSIPAQEEKTPAEEKPETTQVATATPPTDLKDEFVNVIKTWQKIKKVAVRQRQTGELNEILSGRALDKQTIAINWLLKNHKYYEMVPKAVSVEKFSALAPGRKYAVFASVREQSKYIDESTGQTLKDTDDTYKVNYTVERVGEKWVITDSALVSSTSSPQGTKPPAKASR